MSGVPYTVNKRPLYHTGSQPKINPVHENNLYDLNLFLSV